MRLLVFMAVLGIAIVGCRDTGSDGGDYFDQLAHQNELAANRRDGIPDDLPLSEVRSELHEIMLDWQSEIEALGPPTEADAHHLAYLEAIVGLAQLTGCLESGECGDDVFLEVGESSETVYDTCLLLQEDAEFAGSEASLHCDRVP